MAEELLIKTRGTQLGRMQVKDLVNGLNDVTISGRVLTAWPPQTFQRRDGTVGRVMRMIIVDRSGKVRCALWDRHVETVSHSKLQGGIVRIGHAYTRQGLAGDTEVHAGDRSAVEINPPEMPTADFPEFSELFTSIGEIPSESNQINVVGVIQVEPRHHSFAKEERVGAVLNTIIADQSGRMPLVAWNERAEELRDLKKGDILQIVNARTRLNQNSKPELHVESRSQVTLLQQPPIYLKLPSEQTYRIADLTTETPFVDLTVSIAAKGEHREIKRPTGETIRFSSILVGDETGMLTLSLWDDKADLVGELREGDVIRLHGVSVREKLGELRLSLGRSGELQKVNAVQRLAAPTKVSSLATVKGLVTVEGTVADQPVIRQVSTEKGETIEVASFTLKEETGSTRVTFWRDQVSLAKELRPNCRLRITGVRVRPGLNGQMELSSVPVTTVSILSTPIEKPAWEDIRKIISLEAGLETWIKGQVVESGDRKLKIDDGTGVTDVAWDDNVSNQIGNMSEVIGKELEIYGFVQKIDENRLIFKASKVLFTDK